MDEPLILKTNKKPTMFNKEMAIGFLLPSAGLGGTILGGIIGKERMERELIQGKLIDKPSVFNKSALIGGLIGAKAGLLIGAITAAALIATTEVATPGIMTAAMVTAEATAATSLAAIILPALAVAAAGFAIGAYIGGRKGKKTQEKEYAEALAQNEEKARAQSIGLGLEQEQGLGKSHAAEILRQREIAQNLQR